MNRLEFPSIFILKKILFLFLEISNLGPARTELKQSGIVISQPVHCYLHYTALDNCTLTVVD